VVEVVELLRGGGPPDLRAITVELTAEMVLLAGAAPDLPAARAAVEGAIGDGRGLAKLEEIVRAQGGDPEAIRDTDRLPRAPRRYDVPSPADGHVAGIDGEAIGLAAVALGAGRARVEDPVDPAVGVEVLKKVGDRVERGEPLCRVHEGPRSEPRAATIARLLRAYRLEASAPAATPLVLERMA
jgi:pyrimidine-nucleoside phosphorylase/thymidine phosphorylase